VSLLFGGVVHDETTQLVIVCPVDEFPAAYIIDD
jgi:hypothetical protein